MYGLIEASIKLKVAVIQIRNHLHRRVKLDRFSITTNSPENKGEIFSQSFDKFPYTNLRNGRAILARFCIRLDE